MQTVHSRPITPIIVSRRLGARPQETLAEARRHRPTGEEVLAGQALFRASVYELGNGAVLVCAVHHLITDGWSDGVIWRDLSELYRARVERCSPRLPEVAFAYARFAEGQHARWPVLRTKVVDYWKDALAEYSGHAAWPMSSPPCSGPFELGSVRMRVAAEVVSRVRVAARACRVSRFMVLLTASASAIAKVTGQRDLMIGSNTANREDPAKHEAVGYFTNTRLTRARFPKEMAFSERVARVREQWLAGDDLRDAYVDQVLAVIGGPGLIKVDLLDPLTAFRGHRDGPHLPGITTHPVNAGGTPLHWRDLTVSWIPRDDAFEVELRYRTASVDATTATAIGEETLRVLNRLEV